MNEYDKAEIHVDLLVRAEKAAEQAENILNNYSNATESLWFVGCATKAHAWATLSLALSKLAES